MARTKGNAKASPKKAAAFKTAAKAAAKAAGKKTVKKEQKTPQKRKQPEEGSQPDQGSQPGEGSQPEQGSEPVLASSSAAAPSVATATKPEKASAPKAKPEKAGQLPAPGKEAWKDVHTQVMKLSKGGDHKLRNAWEKAKNEGTQQAKRDFYYNIFLLDSSVAKKEVHKTSLERLTETEKSLKGWMTSFQIAKLQGADPQDPNFKELEKAAVQGLEWRPHEVKAWADMGIRQYKVKKEMATEEARTRESSTAAHQSVADLDTAEFQQVEKALMAKPEERQVLLGSRKSKPEKALAEAVENEPEEANPAEQYKEAYKSLKKAINGLSSSLDKLKLLVQAYHNAKAQQPSPQLEASCNELESLEKGYSKSKSDLLKALSMFRDTLDQPEEGSELIQQLLDKKQECDEKLKSLNKAVNPHKLWAKNAKLI